MTWLLSLACIYTAFHQLSNPKAAVYSTYHSDSLTDWLLTRVEHSKDTYPCQLVLFTPSFVRALSSLFIFYQSSFFPLPKYIHHHFFYYACWLSVWNHLRWSPRMFEIRSNSNACFSL